jgi:4-amino-4-deoxy-L-arabinose transferase-like glycosyltransferase
MQTLHWARDRLVGERTALRNGSGHRAVAMTLKGGSAVPFLSSPSQTRFGKYLKRVCDPLKLPSDANRILLIFLGLFVFVRTILSLWLPFGWDHGMMAEVGHTILEGGLPYRDVWDMKGPVAYVVFAAAEAIFGRNMWGVRVVDAAIMVSAAAILGGAASRLSSPTYGPWAALGFLFLISSNGWFFTTQPDAWVAAAATLAIAPYLNSTKHPTLLQAWLSGSMIGLAALIKPLYIIFVLSPAAAIALQNKRGLSERFRHWLMLGFGLSVPIIVILLVYVEQSALASLIEVHILYPIKSYSNVGQLSFRTIASNFADHLRKQPMAEHLPLVALAGISSFIVAAIWNLRKNPTIFATLTTWTGTALFCIIFQAQFFAYHWYPLYPPAVILAVVGLASVNIAASQRSIIVRRLYFSALSVPLLITPAKETLWTAQYILGLTTEAQYYSKFQFREYNVSDQVEAETYLSTQSNPADQLFVLGHESIINYLTGLKPPTRFIFSLPLFAQGPFLHEYRSEALVELARAKPRYVIKGTSHGWSKFPEFESWLDSHYQRTRSFGYLDLYERRTQSDDVGTPSHK